MRYIITAFLFAGIIVGQSVSGWRLDYSTGVSLTNTQEGPTFTFPGAKGSVNYMTMPWLGTSFSSVSLTAQITLGGPTQFLSVDPAANACPSPAAARLYMERPYVTKGPPAKRGYKDYDRWWSSEAYVVLGPGTTTISTQFDPTLWTNVWGHHGETDADHLAGFLSAVGQGGRIGLTFGAGCFYGHGVNANGGPAKFTILDLHFD